MFLRLNFQNLIAVSIKTEKIKVEIAEYPKKGKANT